MAGENRQSSAAVAEPKPAAPAATAPPTAPTAAGELFARLQADPTRFGFFSAVRLLEAAFADRPRIGTSLRPTADPVRFAQDPSVAFATSTLAQFRPGDAKGPARLTQNFFGLTGPHGPMPLHLSEYARDRLRQHRDPTFARFLDVFHHRMTSLFYRAWAAAHPAASFDRPDESRFRLYIGSSVGLADGSLHERDAMPDLAKLHFAGRFACPAKSAEGLRGILSGFFGLPVTIACFVGRWMDLPADAKLRLGESPMTGSLGTTAIVGSRVWDVSQKFRLRFGPLSLADYERLLPGSPSLDQLVAAVRNYIGDELLWDVNLVLRRDEVPPCTLGGQARLGMTTWIGAAPRTRDPDDLYLTPHRDPPDDIPDAA